MIDLASELALLDVSRAQREAFSLPDTDDGYCVTADDWEVHHDEAGWYLVDPDELRDAGGYGPNGLSLGWDGRPHYATETEAWRNLK